MGATLEGGLVIDRYDPQRDNAACLALERLAPQGEAFRLSFERSTFHRRAENFEQHRLLVARHDGRLVGVGGVAIKDVVLLGRQTRAAFYFDMRVHPGHRSIGIARQLTHALNAYGRAHSEVDYTYVVDGNRIAADIVQSYLGPPVGQYSYLVYPTFRRRGWHVEVRRSTVKEVHRCLLATAPPFELYTDPTRGGDLSAVVDSWLCESSTGLAGCSAWSNAKILSEVVESIPTSMRSARRMLESWPLRRLPHPHVPFEGERLRSWYLFDVFGRRAEQVAELVRFVASRARKAGIDYLYVPWVQGDDWIDAVKADVPRRFSPQIRYCLYLAGRDAPLLPIGRIYFDIRDS